MLDIQPIKIPKPNIKGKTIVFDKIFIILKEPASRIEELEEIPVLKASEQQVRDKVLDAHKVLMSLNSRNREEFKNLVRALECEEPG